MVGAALSRAIEQRYAAPPLSGDPLAPVRERARAAQRAWRQAAAAGDDPAAAQALETLDQAAREMEAAPEALDASAENRRALEQALVFLAERYDAAGSSTRAEDAMRRLAAIDPSVTFTAQSASPSVQQLYARAVASLPRGALTVDSVPTGCTVVRDGRDAGTAPVEIQDLAPGRHRISVRCGALHSLVHRVDVAARTRATVVIDAQLDSALITQPVPTLRYATAGQARSRLVNDLAVLGRALGVGRIVGVITSEDRAAVVDVSTGSEVGESPVTDGSRLRSLVHQPVATPTATQPRDEPHTATPALSTNNTPVNTTTSPTTPQRPSMVVVRRGGGLPFGAVLLGVLGAGGIGLGVYAMNMGDSRENAAQQSPDPALRVTHEREIEPIRWVQWAGLIAGGTLLSTGILWALFGTRSEEAIELRTSAVPVHGGAVLTVGGVM